MFIANEPSNIFEPRGNGKIRYLVFHYTGTRTISEALQILQGKKDERKSAHYLIDERGNVMWLVDEGMKAIHVNEHSYWDEDKDLDKYSIGIFLQNPGHENGYKEYTRDQTKSLVKVCKNIIDRNRILPYNVLSHSDIAPDYVTSPGENFPWEALSKEDIGLWYKVRESDIIHAYESINDADKIKDMFIKYGYNPEADLTNLITAFQRHFEPEIFKSTSDQIGKPSINTLSRLSSLIRQKEERQPLSI